MTDTALATCRSCGTENPAVARFCMSCGGSLEVPCANCGTELPPAASFCFACGHEIEAGSTAAEPGRSTQDVTDSIAAQLAEVTAGAGERRTVTMLFCDVKDSTATAEKLDPEAWTVIMHETMACFTGAVERYGGTVARLLGDAVLAYFGAPEAHEDDPQRALLAALTIRDDTRDLCQRVRDEHGTDFDVRIGINTGLVVVGEVGSDTYGEYAALGDAANVAARMEQTAEPGTIRIAEPTYKLIAPLFEVEPVGSIEVKGRSEPIAAYEVLAALGTPGQVRGVEGLSAPLVGRADELTELEGALRAVRGGAGRIVSLVAEAGLGKSRLAAELRREASDDDGLEWISGQCHSYDDATPYAPFVSALHDCFGLDVATPPRDRAGALIEAATDLMGQEHRDHAVYLCSMLGLPVPADDREAVAFLDPATLRGRIFDAVSALVGALAARGTVVLELEDLHWADATSIELLEHLLPVTERHGVLLLLLFRPRRDEPSWRVHEVAARDHAHRYVPVELHPLPDDDARELVGHLLRVEGLSPRVRETILRKSEGNPFFVEEVIRSLLDAGIIVREDDRFIATEDVDDISVPDTLAAVLATRLDRLDAPVRKVVQTASVLGRDFSLGTLAALVDPGVDLDVVVADLLRRELLVEADSGDRDRTLRFKHALTRDTAYGTLLLSVRRDLHRIVGKLIEERDPDRVFDLARHFDEADEPMKAVPYLVAAGEKAFGAFSREDAVSFFRRALELWDDTHDIAFARRAYEGLGNALFYLGRPADAVATFEEMLDFAREHGDAAAEVSALNKAGFAALAGLGAVDRAEELMLAAKELAEREDLQTGVAEFHVGYCFLNVSQGRLDRAERYLGEAAEVCFSLDAHHRNFGLVHFANALIYQTRLDEAREALARAREQAELDGDLEHLAEAMAGDAMVDFVCGDPVTAGQKLQEPLELGARIGAIRGLTMTAWVAGSAALSRGELDLAREHFHTAVAKGTASGNTGPAAASLVGLGTIEQLVHGPDASSVEEYFDQARELHTTPIARASTAAIFSQMGFDHLLAGKLDAAESALRIAEEVPSATSKLMAPEVLLCGGGLAMARGDTEEAAELYDRAMAVVEESGLDLFRPRALLGQAVVASVEGDQEQFRALLEEAEQEAIDRVLRIDELVIQRTGADLYAAAGLDAAAAELREHATATVADIAGGLEDAGERREFLRTNTVTG